MSILITILATALGVLGSLCLLVLIMAATPNSTDAQLAAAKRWMLFIAIAGFAIPVAAIWLGRTDRPWWGALVGILPAIGLVGLLIWASIPRR